MAVKTIDQSIHPKLRKLVQDFAKDFFGYVPKPRHYKPKTVSPRRRILRKFDFRKPDRFPVIMPLLILLAAALVLSWLLHYYLQSKSKELEDGSVGRSGEILSKDRIMFVVAHPDDEAMFFAPSVIRLAASKRTVRLLCLTTGNFYGEGEKRTNELYQSAEILGLDLDKVHIFNNKDIQDSNQSWDVEMTSKIIGHYVTKYSIKMLITFDEYGVSGHVNHRSVYFAVRNLISKSEFNSELLAFKLESTNILRKYSWILDLSYCWWSCDQCLLFINNWQQVAVAQNAMRAHESQYVWFRMLYIRLSRYMIMNTLKPIEVEKRDSKHDKTS